MKLKPMTTNPSIWRIEGNELVEQPTMKDPVWEDFINPMWPGEDISFFEGQFISAKADYQRHVASLGRYPHNLPDSLKGKDLREGIDFWLGKHWSNGMVWFPASDETYDSMPDNRRSIIALPISQSEQPISEDGKEFKQLLKRYVTDFALMLKEGENIRSMYEHYEKGNRLSIEKLMLLATPSQEAVEERNNFAISFACWALYDPQAQSYLSAGITALGLLEKYLDRPYISTNTNQQ